MNIDNFALVHRVLTSGGIRAAAQDLGCPASTVAAALNRFQSRIATELVSFSGTRLLLTLEGRRLVGPLGRLAELGAAVETLGGDSNGTDGATGTGNEAKPLRPAVSVSMVLRFLAICRHGSIRSAAIATGLGQPQLTRQMKQFEAAVGGALFTRRRTGVEPTVLGRRLLPLAEEIEAQWLAVNNGSSERFRRDSTRIRLGAVNALGFESRLSRMLALLVAEWPKRRPGLQLFVSAGTAEELIAGLRTGQYDLALLDTQAVPEEMQGTVVSRSPLAVVSSFELAARHAGGLADLLANAPVAAPSLRNGLRQRIDMLVENALAGAGAPRRRVAVTEVDMLPVIASLVAEHAHVSVLPVSSLAGLEPHVSSTVLDEGYDMFLSLVQSRSGVADGAMRTALAILEAHRLIEAEPSPRAPAS
ncbi:LysR family transcriptional regulator [Aureimonas flava]|nr:LysR family transcriptional regulator [Aureimonas flava]